jgi:membrane protein implicated in regulation of membrane protease activity
MIDMLKEGWKTERREMFLVLGLLLLFVSLTLGGIIALWIGGEHTLAALAAGYTLGHIERTVKDRR